MTTTTTTTVGMSSLSVLWGSPKEEKEFADQTHGLAQKHAEQISNQRFHKKGEVCKALVHGLGWLVGKVF